MHRASRHLEAPLTEPRLGPLQQGVGHLAIVDALEEAEEANAVIMMTIVAAVLDRRDATEWASAAFGDEERTGGVPVEWIATGVEGVPHHRPEWWDPRPGPVGQNRPRDIDEAGRSGPA